MLIHNLAIKIIFYKNWRRKNNKQIHAFFTFLSTIYRSCRFLCKNELACKPGLRLILAILLKSWPCPALANRKSNKSCGWWASLLLLQGDREKLSETMTLLLPMGSISWAKYGLKFYVCTIGSTTLVKCLSAQQPPAEMFLHGK